jgi:hypothetical protein
MCSVPSTALRNGNINRSISGFVCCWYDNTWRNIALLWLFKWQQYETEQLPVTGAYFNTWTFTYSFPEAFVF